MRYAIDEKPQRYVNYDGVEYEASDDRGVHEYYSFLDNIYNLDETNVLIRDCKTEIRRLTQMAGASLIPGALDDITLDVLLTLDSFIISNV